VVSNIHQRLVFAETIALLHPKRLDDAQSL